MLLKLKDYQNRHLKESTRTGLASRVEFSLLVAKNLQYEPLFGLSSRTCASVSAQIASISDDLPIPGEASVARIGLDSLPTHWPRIRSNYESRGSADDHRASMYNQNSKTKQTLFADIQEAIDIDIATSCFAYAYSQ